MIDVVVDHLDLPGGRVRRARPRSFEDVREAEALAGRGRPTPYWATPWPSGTALAELVATVGDLSGVRVLELGCGIGMPSVAAARAGAEVLATDGSPEAVVYTAHNLAINDVPGEVAVAAWSEIRGTYDVLLAADVLYTHANAEQLARMLPRLLAPGGEAWVADPGRANCKEFLALVRRRWRLETMGTATLKIHRLRRRARFARQSSI